MQVPNKVFIVILPVEILLGINTLLISTSFLKNRHFIAVKLMFLNFNIAKHSNFVRHFYM